MENVVFPIELLDLPEVADLPAEYKLALCALAVHPRLSACSVLAATGYVVAQLPLTPDVFWGVVADLVRREIVIADRATSEIFVLRAFHWHRAPAEDEDTPWARQVRAAASRVVSGTVRAAVTAAISRPPPARLARLKIPANLISAIPPRGRGQAWTASETLVHFALAVNPDQTPAGVFTPCWPAVAAFCSLPVQTVLECVDALAAGGLVAFDKETGELFSAARFRAASEREVGKILKVAEGVRSWSIFCTLREAATRLFPKITIKAKSCAPVDVRGVDVTGRDAVLAQRIAALAGQTVRDPVSGEVSKVVGKGHQICIGDKSFFGAQILSELDRGRLELA